MRVLCAAILTFLCATAAAAPPAKGDLDKAKAHFRAGETAYRAGDYDKAIVEYQAAYVLVMRPQLLFNLGAAYRRKGEVTGAASDKRQALEYYRKYVEAEPDGKGAADAKRFIEILERETAEPSPAEPAPAPEPPGPPPEPAPVASAPPAATDVAAERPRATYRVAGAITAGAGVALVAAGVYFGLRAKSLSNELSDLADGGTWDQSKYDAGRAANRNMYIFGGLGVAALAGGAVLYFVLGREREPGVAVLPAAAPQGGGLQVVGRF
ncbi:MAG TPA: hypothetical protein VKE22_28500 [Haliangiales bacterium]|nr:hypothetical protein [Haliangiales bacterium]